MKQLKTLFTVFLAFNMLVFLASCGEDEGPSIGTGGSVPVGDGWYMMKGDETPTAMMGLYAENVEAAGFQTQPRDGYGAGYMYLEAGDYNLVQVKSQEIEESIGGTVETVTAASDCDENDSYMLIDETVVDGPAFNIANNGFYKVIFDAMTTEILIYEIGQAEVIGSATPAGWSYSADQVLDMTQTDEGVTFSIEGQELRPGAWKVRFNCRWTIDRRIDNTIEGDAVYDPSNGYVALTNYGGTASNLEAGGSDFQIATGEDGLYDISLSLTGDGVSLSSSKTAELEPITFNPDENEWAITGDATANGWADEDATNDPIGVDMDLNYEGVSNGTYTWKGTFDLVAGQLKFRTNDSWTKNLGYDDVTVTGDMADITDGDPNGGNSNFVFASGGTYIITLSTSDAGETYTANFDKQ